MAAPARPCRAGTRRSSTRKRDEACSLELEYYEETEVMATIPGNAAGPRWSSDAGTKQLVLSLGESGVAGSWQAPDFKYLTLMS